jgi:hypothetical protein
VLLLLKTKEYEKSESLNFLLIVSLFNKVLEVLDEMRKTSIKISFKDYSCLGMFFAGADQEEVEK